MLVFQNTYQPIWNKGGKTFPTPVHEKIGEATLAGLGKIKEIGSKLFFPNKKDDQKNLNDSSFRQNNIFSKTQNVFVINDKDSGKKFLGDIDNIPPVVIDLLNKQFSENESKPVNEIRLIDNKFENEIIEYTKHIEKQHKVVGKILPYINEEYRSILQLSTYAESLYKKGENQKGNRVKNDIQYHYGKRGRKLSNLYTSGYVADMIEGYLDKLSEAKDKEEYNNYVNEIITLIIAKSEHIFFVNEGHNDNKLAKKVITGMEKSVEYIALHSAGLLNTKKTDDVLKIISGKIEELGYEIKTERLSVTASLTPIFNVYITKSDI